MIDDTATMTIGATPVDCAVPDPDDYQRFQANFGSGTVSGTADAIGPDGTCLVRYEIKPGNTFPSGRSYADEMQNFANWFTYYRKRHQALRGGITRALLDIDGVRIGQVQLNDLDPVTMRSLTTDKADILDDLLEVRGAGGTPTREALDYVGRQYERTGGGAPIEYACQKNYGIVFTDGFANASGVSGIANEDNNVGVPYEDTWSDTLADIAWKYYTDLGITGFATGQVPTPAACAAGTDPTLDCNEDLHMATFSVALNAQGTIYNVTHFDVADAHAVPPAWPNPNLWRNPRMVDDLYHAAVNGRGEMLNARTPEEIATKMADVFKTVVETEGSAAAVTFNTGLLSSDSVVYQAKLDSEDWSGFLTASDLVTFDGDGVPFRDAADLTPAQVADLSVNLPGGLTVQDVVDYLRGDRSNESPTLFRERSARTILGDIVHSSPVFVGEPSSDWPSVAPFPTGLNAYSNFKQVRQHAGRRPARADRAGLLTPLLRRPDAGHRRCVRQDVHRRQPCLAHDTGGVDAWRRPGPVRARHHVADAADRSAGRRLGRWWTRRHVDAGHRLPGHRRAERRQQRHEHAAACRPEQRPRARPRLRRRPRGPHVGIRPDRSQ